MVTRSPGVQLSQVVEAVTLAAAHKLAVTTSLPSLSCSACVAILDAAQVGLRSTGASETLRPLQRHSRLIVSTDLCRLTAGWNGLLALTLTPWGGRRRIM